GPERDREIRENPPPETYPRTDGVYREFASACKDGPPAGSNFPEHAGPLTKMVLLGNLSVRAARELELDPSTGEIANAVRIPEHYVRAPYRSGWTW
ncbi:MAG: gfo/Idh/MocA family oxidoreductase, partial [Gemmatimonadota bacterium]|nr:gfo/Idh/MocA family oxidoreductase [Gemmatimonadota bacterium]